jgi:chorismate mutase
MSDEIPEQLLCYRDEIDALDVKLLDLLAKRIEIVRAVGALKSREDLPVVQSARAEEVKDRAVALAVARGVDAGFIRAFYEMMIDHAHVLEHAIVNDAGKE